MFKKLDERRYFAKLRREQQAEDKAYMMRVQECVLPDGTPLVVSTGKDIRTIINAMLKLTDDELINYCVELEKTSSVMGRINSKCLQKRMEYILSQWNLVA